jgi:FixJ family two-component response regulator
MRQQAALPFHSTPLIRRIEERLRIDLDVYIEQAYFVQGLSQREIGDDLGVAETTVHCWRVQLGLPSWRNRQAAIALTRKLLTANRRTA